jgi:hypothetical protein
MADDIEVHFNRLGLSGGTLVVVAIGTDVYGATDQEPVAALRAAALPGVPMAKQPDPRALAHRCRVDASTRRTPPWRRSCGGAASRHARPKTTP